MKCIDAEKGILLKDANELNNRQLNALNAHINGCKNCQQFQSMLTTVKGEATANAEPPDFIIQNILREAQTQAPTRKQPTNLIYWKPMLAVAASAVMALGLFFTHPSTPNENVGIEITLTDTQLLDLDDQVVSVMYSGLSEDDLAFNFMMSYDG